MTKPSKPMTHIVTLVTVAVCALALAGCGGQSASEQADAFLAQVKEDMTWEQVLKVKVPRKFQVGNPKSINGYGPPIKFDRAAFEKKVAENGYEYGFAFRYAFSAERTHLVLFDSKGVVQEINKEISMGDLMQPGGYKP